MKFYIQNQESYSRGELLLRTFFGYIYIAIPHMFLLLFLGIASSFVTFIAFWAILFTGRYPRGMYEFQEKLIRWRIRVNARLMNLVDGYPSFGLSSEDDYTDFRLEYPERMNRGTVLLRALFGVIYVIIPHMFILFFRMIGVYFVVFIAWWAVLFTGKYPEGMHRFVVNTLRWQTRVSLYMSYLSDIYPPFSGKPDEELGLATAGGPSADASSGEGSSEENKEG